VGHVIAQLTKLCSNAFTALKEIDMSVEHHAEMGKLFKQAEREILRWRGKGRLANSTPSERNEIAGWP
jgi:hypothetical protein